MTVQRQCQNRCRFSVELVGWFIFLQVAIGIGVSFAAETRQADSEVLVAKGVVAYDEQRYDDALRLLSRARELNPHDARGLYYLGLTQLALKNPTEAVTALAAARQLRPTDPAIGYQLGVAYFTVGRYDEATPFLEQAYQADPSSENLGYYVGLIRYRQKDYKPAVEAFDATKTTDPNVQQLTQFYRGMALGILGLSKEASAELQQLERADVGLPFSGPARQIQEAIAARQTVDETRRLTLQVSVGGYYNDNVAVTPNKNTTQDAATNILIQDLRSRKTKSPGTVGSLLIDYAFYRKGPIEAVMNYSFFQTLNWSDGLNDFNIQSHLPGVSGFYRGVVADKIPFQVAVEYKYNRILLKNKSFMSSHSPTLTASLVPPSFSVPLLGTVGNLTSVISRWQRKKFFREPADNDFRFNNEQRDAYNTMVGIVHAFRFAQDKLIVRAGYQFDNENATGSSTFSYNGNRVQAGVQSSLPFADMIFRYDFDIHFRNYNNTQTLFKDDNGQLSKRDDTQQIHTTQLVYPLSKRWSVTAQYQHVSNKSNVPLYDYKQNVMTGLVTWTY
jgi:tetratricopeptide (TPR) repeat protein